MFTLENQIIAKYIESSQAHIINNRKLKYINTASVNMLNKKEIVANIKRTSISVRIMIDIKSIAENMETISIVIIIKTNEVINDVRM